MIRTILTTAAIVAVIPSGATYAADDTMTERPAAKADTQTGTVGIAIFKTTDPDRSGTAYYSALPSRSASAVSSASTKCPWQSLRMPSR